MNSLQYQRRQRNAKGKTDLQIRKAKQTPKPKSNDPNEYSKLLIDWEADIVYKNWIINLMRPHYNVWRFDM